MPSLKASLVTIVAAGLSVLGVALLFVAAYLTGFDWLGLAVGLLGVTLFATGAVALLRQDSALSDRLAGFVEDLLMGT